MAGPLYVRCGEPVKAVHGVIPGSTAHLMLLALRGGSMSSEQIHDRFKGTASITLHRLRADGLLTAPTRARDQANPLDRPRAHPHRP